MVRTLVLFIITIAIVLPQAVAQEKGEQKERLRTEMPDYLKYPIDSEGLQPTDESDTKSADMNDDDRELLAEIAKIYRLHVLSVEAQVDNDALSAEKYIMESISHMQELMDVYPEIQDNKRFTELYRTVMTEHREFYGIEEPSEAVEGEIFAIHQEMFSSETDLDVEDYTLPKDVTLKETKVPLIQNRQVSRHLMYYTLRRPEVMEAWLQRSATYFPMIERILKEEGMPDELKHLAMIESGLVPHARSHAAAVGMWQFIQATGSMYGLEVNWWIDERRDPEKATRAAARHLKDLHNIWGDWHLALANYNVSPRRLKRAIRAGGGKKDYWSAYPFLPRETRGYVPGFIAATIVATHPEEFGFNKTYTGTPYQYEVHEVDGLMRLDLLAKAAGITTDELKKYNPELLRWATPPGSKYPLKLPVGTKQKFAAAYDDIPKEEREKGVMVHTVRRGETLGYIARKYGTSVHGLYEVNAGLSHIIHPGQKVMVPTPAGSTEKIAANRPTHQPRNSSPQRSRRSRYPAPANSSKLYYQVKRGDTIGHIAEWYDTKAWKIRAWNGTGNTIRPGQRLTVYVPESKDDYYRQIDRLSFAKKQSLEQDQRRGKDITQSKFATASGSTNLVNYTVRRNDTLIDIATMFGTTVAEIRQLNNIRGSRIYVGQTLKVRKSD